MCPSDPRFEYTMNDFLDENIEHFVERARLMGNYAEDPDRLDALLYAGIFDDGPLDIELWKELADTYPQPGLIADELTRNDNEDVPVRAYFLAKAVGSLLKIVEAPEAMRSDLSRFLARFLTVGARKYGDAQRALIENPEMPIAKVSEKCGLDRSTMHVLLKKGVLIRPNTPAREYTSSVSLVAPRPDPPTNGPRAADEESPDEHSRPISPNLDSDF